MSNADQELEDRPDGTDALDNVVVPEEKPPLNLDVNIEQKSACERHVTVSVAREDVDRYLAEKVDELLPEAEVPGFRPGRAPRKLVESRFKHQLRDQVKGSLLLDAMTQVTDADGFSAISEPDFDFDAIDIPDEGPFTFEFDIEVRPDFDLPEWKGLEIERPTRDFNDSDVEAQLQNLVESSADLVPQDGPAELNDYVVVKMVSRVDGKTIAKSDEETICVRPTLNFPDAKFEGFSDLIVGAKAGEKKSGTCKISDEVENESLSGKEVDVEFDVLDIKRVDKENLDTETLHNFGDFDSVDELRDAIRGELNRRLSYEQERRVRDQITELLTESATWELPPDLLRRQSSRELQRAVLEMRASGFNESMIKAYENELRQNSLKRTEKALKEHFILERIAEDLDIEASDDDYETELALIAAQQRDSVRRVRAKMEKSGQMDALRNQIIERQVIRHIMDAAKFKDVPYELKAEDTSAVDFYVSGGEKEADIPEAKYADQAEPLQQPKERD